MKLIHTNRQFLYHELQSKVILARMSEQSSQVTDLEPLGSDLLDPYEKLIPIEILGQRIEVPENNRLLRCFQYLSLNTISYGDFCWNGECTNCQIWYHLDGQTAIEDRPGLACRMEVSEEMVITRLNSFIQLEGINK